MLYVQDVKSAQGAAIWKGVFIADISNPAAPRITLAQQGILVSEGPDTLHLHLTNGSTHETDPKARRTLIRFRLSSRPIFRFTFRKPTTSRTRNLRRRAN